jgi:signal peptidase I
LVADRQRHSHRRPRRRGDLFFGTFCVQVVQVGGFSMAPTLEDHDQRIVDKLTYEFGDPRPGDVVTLYYPPNPSRLYLKRVIAKDGDTVQIVDGRVLVNQQPLRDDYVSPAYRDHGNWGPQVIRQGYDFVRGDHRNNSSDSVTGASSRRGTFSAK